MTIVYDQLMYTIRLFGIAFVCGIFAVILVLLSPSVDSMPLQAELFAARVVYDGGFSLEPGVLSEELYTTIDTADYNPFPGNTVYWIGGRARVLDLETKQPLFQEPLVYNQPAYDILSSQRSFSTPKPAIWMFPVTLERIDGTRERVLLELEVLYDTR